MNHQLIVQPDGAITRAGIRLTFRMRVAGVSFDYRPPSAKSLDDYLKTHLTPGWQAALDQVYRLDSAMKARNWGGMPCPRRIYGDAEVGMDRKPTGKGDLVFYWGIMSSVIVRFGANGKAVCTVGGSMNPKRYGPFLDAPSELLDCLEFHARQEAMSRVSI